jgi:cytochrome c biogenesis protein CcdA
MEVWTVLFPILLTDVVNPVLFAFMVYAAGSNRPVLLSSSMLLGHTVAYFSAGIVLALFMETIASWFANPRTIDFVIELMLGLVLLWVALGSRKTTGKRPDENTPELTVLSSFGYGAVVNFIGIPFAVPYFAAIDQILKTDLSTMEAVLMLLSYNLAYAVPFALVPLLSAVMGERAKPILGRINEVLDKVSGFLMPAMLGLIGLALLADAIKYFVTGTSLF